VSARTRFHLAGAGLSVGLAFAQFRLIAMVLGENYRRSVEAALGVVAGRPHWRMYQSRVLATHAVAGLARLMPSPSSAHVLFSIVALAVAGWLCWRLGHRQAGTRGALLAIVSFHACFAMLLSPPWLYAWDFVDAIVFILFVQFVAEGRRWPFFLGLFAIGLFNHEVAMFVAAWMIVDPVARWVSGRRKPGAPAFDRTPAQVGLICLGASVLVVDWLRDALLIEEVGPKIFSDAPKDAGGSFHWRLLDNLSAIGRAFTVFDYWMPFVVVLFLLAVIAILIALVRRDPGRYLGLAITYFALGGSLLVFGLVLETRVYVVLIPVVVLGALVLPAQDGPEQGPRPP